MANANEDRQVPNCVKDSSPSKGVIELKFIQFTSSKFLRGGKNNSTAFELTRLASPMKFDIFV